MFVLGEPTELLDVAFGSWLCENAVALAVTTPDYGDALRRLPLFRVLAIFRPTGASAASMDRCEGGLGPRDEG